MKVCWYGFTLAICFAFIPWVWSEEKNFHQSFTNFLKESKPTGKVWVVLVAGSKEFYNYRHQANICHAYQIVHRHGVPDENIIVMMADTLAYDKQNPTPGIIINYPNGYDVYHGVPKDYVGRDVSVANFKNVLTGKSNSGKVLKSTSEDNVFIYFADHGGPGFVVFPYGDLLFKDMLHQILLEMHENQMYKQMVLYIESCHSATMLSPDILPSINVYATSSANASQSSYACYFDTSRNVYLGDRYSVSWMEHADLVNVDNLTLESMYQFVKNATKSSNVQEFGDTHMDTIDTFGAFVSSQRSLGKLPYQDQYDDDVPAWDVKYHTIQNGIRTSTNETQKQMLLEELEYQKALQADITELFTVIVQRATSNHNELSEQILMAQPALTHMDCYKEAVKAFETYCFELINVEFSIQKTYILANLCESFIPIESIELAIFSVCTII